MSLLLLLLLLLLSLLLKLLLSLLPSSLLLLVSALNSVKVLVTDDEPIENALRRFKKNVNQSGHLMDLKFKEHWETAADKKKRKAERARQLSRIERTNDRYERRNDGVSEYNT